MASINEMKGFTLTHLTVTFDLLTHLSTVFGKFILVHIDIELKQGLCVAIATPKA